MAFELPISPDAAVRTGYRAAMAVINEYLRLEIWEIVGSYFWKRIAVFNDVVCPLTLIIHYCKPQNVLSSYLLCVLSLQEDQGGRQNLGRPETAK